jgi:hypothetical protein
LFKKSVLKWPILAFQSKQTQSPCPSISQVSDLFLTVHVNKTEIIVFGEDCQRPATEKRSTVATDPQVVKKHRMGLAISQWSTSLQHRKQQQWLLDWVQHKAREDVRRWYPTLFPSKYILKPSRILDWLGFRRAASHWDRQSILDKQWDLPAFNF